MAFSLDYLQRVQAGVDLNKISNPLEGQVTGSGPTQWQYNALAAGANNSKAQTVAADYFLGAFGYLSVGDTIYVPCNDGYQLLVVTASSSVTVTTSAAWTL